MDWTNFSLGTLTYNATTAAYDFTGPLFRVIPHSSTEPLNFNYSMAGGRWNEPQTFPTIYTFVDTATARQYMTAQEIQGNFSWREVQPEHQLDLLVLNCNVSGLADLATTTGLAVYNLPPSYPRGFEFSTSWALTQPIGKAVFESGVPGLVARSASATDFSGPMAHWAEVVMFADRVPRPDLVDRLAFADWYDVT